jgi:hypothetical protein
VRSRPTWSSASPPPSGRASAPSAWRVALFDAAPRRRPPEVGGRWVDADPLATFDVKRFNAIRAYQAQQGRELSRCLRELRLLRRDALATEADEHEPAPTTATPESRNEPDAPAAPPPAPQAAAPASPPPLVAVENEPKILAGTDLPLLRPRYPVPLPGPLDEPILAHGTLFTLPATVDTRAGRERPRP